MEPSGIPEKAIQDDKFLNALAEAFRLQEAIINSTGLAIISTDPEGVITSFNRAAEHLLGYQAEEVIGKANPLIFFDMGQLVETTDSISAALGIRSEPVFDVLRRKANLENPPCRAEWTMIRKDGTRFPAEVSISPLRDEERAVIGYVALTEDLTEKKLARDKAEAAENKFRVLAENIPGVIYLCRNDADYTVIYVNDRIHDLTGYTVEEFMRGEIGFTALCHPDDVSMVQTSVAEALQAKKRFHVTYRIRNRAGEWKWVDEVGTGVYQDDGLLMLEGFVSDITEHKIAEEKLLRAAEENERVFNNPVNLNVIAGFDGYFRRVSSTWFNVLGWTEEELTSKPFIEFVHPDDVQATVQAAAYIVDGNDVQTFENRYRRRDGSYRWLLWGAASDPKNNVIYASAIDITERKKSEEELLKSKKNLESVAIKLQEQNRQLDEFAHIISHNLRSPIGNIQALISLLDDNSAISDYKMIFDKLRNVAKNLGETMNDLMDTMKARAATNVDRIEVRFKDVLDKVVQSLEGDLIMAEASVTFDFNSAPAVFYPKAYIESIFQNLLSNAIKYRSPDRKPLIHFQSAISGGRVELRVSDNGLGIDMGKFGDKLFGLHRTFHIHEEARGVGLFLIKTQLESLGGTIHAESEVNKGTTFIIAF